VGAAFEGDLGADDWTDLYGAAGLREADRAVEGVVIGERERREAKVTGALGELLGVRGAVEKRVIAVAVELGVGLRRH
jgi:hypothetical protein